MQLTTNITTRTLRLLCLALCCSMSLTVFAEDKPKSEDKPPAKADESKSSKDKDTKDKDAKDTKKKERRKLGAAKDDAASQRPQHDLPIDQLKAPIPRKIKGYQSVNYDKLTAFEYFLRNLDEEAAEKEADKGQQAPPPEKDKTKSDKSKKDEKGGSKSDIKADKSDKADKGKKEKVTATAAPKNFEKQEAPEGFIPREDKVIDPNDAKVKAAAMKGDRQIPEPIRKLHKKKVAIAGYMIPIDFRKGGTNEFILVKIVPSCFFCQQPFPNEWIDVKVKDGKRVPYEGDNPITVAGVIEVGAKYEKDVFLNLYRMEAHVVEVHPVQ